MEKQKCEKEAKKAQIKKNSEKQKSTVQISKSEQEPAEGRVIYINLMSVVIPCVMICIGFRMLPLKAHQTEKEAVTKDLTYEVGLEVSENEEDIVGIESDQQDIEHTEVIDINTIINQEIKEEPQVEAKDKPQQKYYIQNVPFINQFTLGYPMGCEAVSATMASKYAGYNIEIEDIVTNTPTDYKGKRQETKVEQIETINQETGEVTITSKEETVWVGENPFKFFVGDPKKDKTQGAYGCFAAPIVTALNNCGISCTDVSGNSVDVLYDYIKQGKPVIVWCRVKAQDLIEGVTWQYPDR